MLEVRCHVAEADDALADVAFGRACPIGQFVGRKAGQQYFCARHTIWIAFLWDDQMAELAEDEFARASCRTVVRKSGQRRGNVVAVGAWPLLVEGVIVMFMT